VSSKNFYASFTTTSIPIPQGLGVSGQPAKCRIALLVGCEYYGFLMSKDTLIAKYETLPVVAQKQVETFIEFLLKTTPTKSARSAKRRFNFDWAGGLADLKGRFTAVELQHHLNELR
jgi:hypothetical protein